MRGRLRLVAFLAVLAVGNVGMLTASSRDARALSGCSGNCGCEKGWCETGECYCQINPMCAGNGGGGSCASLPVVE